MRKNYSGLSTTIVFWTRRLSLSILLAGCLCSPSWGQVKTIEIVGNPTVHEDEVKLRIKVTDTNNRPLMGLQPTDFNVEVDKTTVKFKSKNWKSSEQTEPPPTWIVVLLDFSGSMQQMDSRGTTKLEGAIAAIRKFTAAIAERSPNTQIAIVPFGDPGVNCSGYPVDRENLDKFFPASDFKLGNYLDFLGGQIPCASTNLYEPVTKTINFLSSLEDSRFYVTEKASEESSQPQPKLAVVLLSDGYHNKPNEQQDFDSLISLLKQNDRIIVHTLGYGLTSEQLGQKYQLKHPATRADIGTAPNKVPEEEFVDQKRLAEIAKATGGIAEFSPDAETVAAKLKVFLNALLGEYEIVYTDPSGERGSKHDVSVKVQSVTSESKPYTITVFGRSLPLSTRLLMLAIVLLTIGVAGVLPFSLWAKHLKREAQEA
ncbi:vWA domain-containing protein [Chroococcidiopsis sp. CCNUC1]|uniref:vWA domain-containing protein n=1 Tax=Chroococcidiopsis sp. CCNUC1 TaxID=2653189 RepID=UPI00201FD51C|nr:vWA domain-containing protein [Chroococcidiopsis sp. CCNUC1]URD48716.1 VWA domain-containing protein [Chroococcidiopsis sp. CCNUC1]